MARSGEQDGARSADSLVDAFFRAAVFAALREPDSAFAWVGRVAESGPSPLSVLRMDPRLAPIRADPRCARLLARLGLTARTPAPAR